MGAQLRKSLAKKTREKQTVGAIAVNAVEEFFGVEVERGFLRFSKLFLKLKNRGDQLRIFAEQKNFLAFLAEKFRKMGVAVEVDGIFFK